MAQPTSHYFPAREVEVFEKGYGLELGRVPRREGRAIRASMCGVTVEAAGPQEALDALFLALSEREIP